MLKPLPDFEELDDTLAEILRKKSPAERLAIGYGMWRYARDTIFRVVQVEHPEWSSNQVQRETARRLLHGAE